MLAKPDVVYELFTSLKDSALKIKPVDIKSLLERLDQAQEQSFDSERYVHIPKILANGEDAAEYLSSEECPHRFRYVQYGHDVVVVLMPSFLHGVIPYELSSALAVASVRKFPNSEYSSHFRVVGHVERTYISETTKQLVGKEPDLAIFAPGVQKDKLPSVVVEIGYSENMGKLRLDLEFWKEKARTSTPQASKLMLILLVDIDMKKKLVTFYFHPEPAFDRDSTLTTVLPLGVVDLPVTQLYFKLEWLYGGKIPEWASSEDELVLGHQLMKKIHIALLEALAD